jgi:OPA family glycerol-3-phosphate transporter-like MFS transporter
MGTIASADALSPRLDTPREDSKDERRLARWREAILALMVLGYAGYYLCRSNLAVATPLVLGELTRLGLTPARAQTQLGLIVTLGVYAYALGKLLGGTAGDFLGGRRNFLLGMAGAVLFTVAFALGGSVPIFTLSWMANRLVQSIGWPGAVKITGRWFAYSSHGAAMGVLSLSYLWGDAIDRLALGTLLSYGLGWRGVFLVSAGVLMLLLVICIVWLKESPVDVGLPETTARPDTVFGLEGGDPRPPGLGALLGPLLRSPLFWIVCILSFGLTLVREAFNAWSVTYFVQAAGLTPGRAGQMSALFPFLGGVSVLAAGVLGDRLGRGGRAVVIALGMLLASGALVGLGVIDPRAAWIAAVGLVSLVGLLVIGPYSYLAGAMALDLGGKRGGATASGLIDFVGYLGGAQAGSVVAWISVEFGWRGVFGTLAGVAVASAVTAVWLYMAQKRTKLIPEVAS